MPVFNESRHAAEFLVSEANGHRSREAAAIGGSAAHEAGTILHNDDGTYIPLAVTAGTPDTVSSADAILYAGVDSTDGTVTGTIITRDAEADWAALTYAAGVGASADSAALIADIKEKLAAAGIIVR